MRKNLLRFFNRLTVIIMIGAAIWTTYEMVATYQRINAHAEATKADLARTRAEITAYDARRKALDAEEKAQGIDPDNLPAVQAEMSERGARIMGMIDDLTAREQQCLDREQSTMKPKTAPHHRHHRAKPATPPSAAPPAPSAP